MTYPLLLIAGLLVAGPRVEVNTLDKQVVTGELTSLSTEQVVIQTADGPHTVPLKEIVSFSNSSVEKPPAAKPLAWLELVDGGRLTAQDFSVSKRVAKITLANGDPLEFPTRLLRIVRFSPPDEKADQLWSEALQGKSGGDLLVVRKKDSLDFLEGTIGNVTADKVDFELGGEPLEVKRPRVDGLIYVSTARDIKDPACIYEDASGWRIPARGVVWEDSAWKVTTPAGVILKRPAGSLAKLDFSSGKVVYLSDLNWESAETKPAFDLASDKLKEEQAPHRDRPPWGKELKINDQPFAKGLCLTSRTQLVYRLPAGMRQFQALAGIDDSVAKSAARVRLRIMADDKTLYDEVIRKGEPARPIEVSVLGANRLKILVEHEFAAAAGRLTLGDARVQR